MHAFQRVAWAVLLLFALAWVGAQATELVARTQTFADQSGAVFFGLLVLGALLIGDLLLAMRPQNRRGRLRF